ncbi:hypothetical protein Nepgr_024296 [Nepenthes gracilis]|uniref:Uncharacterized protein n=1 Tax=Nepenthes gracilis TaxID=150966 RepID=A0AAD3XYN6_NEPGR|nr:hypothetical protein Nepgr_024296 [Nepenthes gracilis]
MESGKLLLQVTLDLMIAPPLRAQQILFHVCYSAKARVLDLSALNFHVLTVRLAWAPHLSLLHLLRVLPGRVLLITNYQFPNYHENFRIEANCQFFLM